MKRALALLLTMLMVFSLFPTTAFAEEATLPEGGGTVASSDSPEPTSEPTATPLPELTPTEAVSSESPSVDALFLNLLDCDSTDSDGAGHVKQNVSDEDTWSLRVKSDSNGEISYRWQTLDQKSAAQDPYVDINTKDNATANDKTLTVAASEDALNVPDYYRCIVTATLGDETITTNCYFTVEKAASEQTPAPTEDPTQPGDGKFDMSVASTQYYATSMEDIIYAIGAGKTDIICSGGSFSITKDLTIPSNVSLSIYSNNFTVTIPTGVTLTNNGLIKVLTMGYLDVSGTIKNAGEIRCSNGGTMTVYAGGSYQKTSTGASLVRHDYGQSGVSNINGVSTNQINYVFEDVTGTGFYAGFEYAQTDFLTKEVLLDLAVTLSGTDHVTIPSNTDVYALDDFTVSSGTTLTNNGTLYVQQGTTLTNSGTIENNGAILVYGTFVPDGVLDGNAITYLANVNSDATLRAAIASGATDINVTSSFSLTSNLTIPDGVYLSLGEYTLTVPGGITLTNECFISTSPLGKLLIKSTGKLVNNGTVEVVGGSLVVESGAAYQSVTGSVSVDVGKGGTVSGVPVSNVNIYTYATTDAMMRSVLSYSGKGYSSLEIEVAGSIALLSNMTIPSDVNMRIGRAGDGFRLTVPTGKTLTNNGYIYVPNGNTLQINAGATLANSGKIEIEIFGELIKNGTITGSGSITYGNEAVNSWDSLVAAVAASRATITLTGDVVMEDNLTIGSGTTLVLDATSAPEMTVAEGYTLTINGQLQVAGGGLTVQSGGALIMNGFARVYGGTFTVASGASIQNNGYFEVSGTGTGDIDKDSYTEGGSAQFCFNDAGGASLTGIELSYVTYKSEPLDSAALASAIAQSAKLYRSVEINLYSSATLSDITIDASVNIVVYNGATLTVEAGKTVTLNGSLEIQAGAKLTILTGAKIVVGKTGSLSISGTLDGAGTIVGDYALSVSTEAALRDAILHGVKILAVVENITLTSNLTIPDDVSVTLLGAILTVPSGKTLQVDGYLFLSNGTLNVSSSGRLINNCCISLSDRSRLYIVSGGLYTQAANASLSFTYGQDTISGIANSLISCNYTASSESQLRSGLGFTTYKVIYVTLVESVTLTSNLTIPVNATLTLAGSSKPVLTIPAGKLLTNNGNIVLNPNSTLLVAVGATLNITKSGSLQILGGSFIASGTVNYEAGAQILRLVFNQTDLENAITAKATQVVICDDIELTKNISIPSTMELAFSEGKTLTVPSGITLAVGKTNIMIYTGSLVVDGGTLSLADGGCIYLDDSGALSFTSGGSISFGGDNAIISYTSTGTSSLSGIADGANDHVIAQTYVGTAAGLDGALTEFASSDYRTNKVILSASIVAAGDITVPSPVALLVEDGYSLTIPVGMQLTIEDGASLSVQNGGKLILLGTLENNGAVTLSLDALSGGGAISGTSEDFSYSAKATTFALLKSAIDSGKRPLKIEAGSFVFSASLIIPADVEVVFMPGTTASIASGVTVTNKGRLTLCGKFTNSGSLINNNYLTVEKSGTFTNNNTFTNNGDADVFGTMVNNGTVNVKTGYRVRFHEDAVKSGTRSTGSWYSIVGQAATAIEIVGPSYVTLGATDPQQYLAQMLPSDAWPMDIKWTIQSGGEFASIAVETGELTAGKKGDVVIRATAMVDGVVQDDIYGEMTVHIVTYALSITGETWMIAGKTLQLSSEFVPSNLTKTSVLWSLADGDAAYASISATGLVTAKAITEEKTITVTARSADGAADAGTKEITIYPVLSGLQILKDDENVTGKTLSLNSYSSDSLTFTCARIPDNAMPSITWTLSETDAAKLTKNEDGSVTVAPVSGKSKLIVLTAKANDGSGKTASVMIQVSAVSSGLTVSDPGLGVLYSGKNTQLVATFTGSQPTNKAVKWVLSPEYDAYATLSATGLLTAKTITQEVIVKVSAVPADGGPECIYAVTIKPLTSTIQLKRGDLYVAGTTQTVDIGHETSLTLTAVVWPDTASQDVTFTSSMKEVATVDNSGVVTVLKTGLTTITATANDGSGKLANVKLNVVTLPQEIEAVTPVYALRGGTSATYRVKDKAAAANVILPASQVRWSIEGDSASFASITTSGLLSTMAVTKPETIILLAEVIGNEENATTSFEVTIYPAAQGIVLYADSFPFKGPVVFDAYDKTEGGIESLELLAKTIPEDAMPDMVWTSSNPTVATVADGVVSPVWNATKGAYNIGTATVTAKTKDGTNLSVSTVVQVVSLVQGITVSTASGSKEVVGGSSVQLKCTLENPTATNTKMYYEVVTGAEFATVSASGLVATKAVYKEQIIVIGVRSADGGSADSIDLTILPKDPDPLVIQPQDGSITLNDTRQNYDVKSAAASIPLAANGYVTGLPVAVRWSVSPSTIGRVSIVSGVPTLQSLSTGVVTITATDAKGRTASFSAEFYKPASTLTINPPKGMDVEALTLGSGKTMQLTAAIAPTSGVTTSGVNWFIGVSLDDRVSYYKETNLASISSTGLVTAKPGLLTQQPITIYAVSKNAPYLTKSVKITLKPAVTGVDIKLGSTPVNNRTVLWDLAATPLYLSSMVYPDTANQAVVWTSSNKAIATVATDGTVTALKAGTVTITATAEGKVASFKLTFTVLTTGIEITSKTGFAARAGGTLQLAAAFTPTNATDKRVTWKLLDGAEQFATISSTGLVTAKVITHQQMIKVQVTSVADETVFDTEFITIYPPTTKVLVLDESDDDVTNKTLILDLNTATEMVLKAKNLPSEDSGALQNVVWKSSNTAVLRVDENGTLTPVKKPGTDQYYTGTVTITATASDGSGKYATVKVFVGYLIKGISFGDGMTVKGGLTLTLKPTIEPLFATNKALKWAILASDTPFATISTSGILTTKKVTEARGITIYCEALDGSGVIATISVWITA